MFSADTLQQALVQDYGRLCTLANKILQDSHLAQDAVQESWLRLNRDGPIRPMRKSCAICCWSRCAIRP